MMSQRNMAPANYEGLKRNQNGQQSRHASLERKKKTQCTQLLKRKDEKDNDPDERTINS